MLYFYGIRQKTKTFYLSSVLSKVFMIFLFSMFYTKIRMIYCAYCILELCLWSLCTKRRGDGFDFLCRIFEEMESSYPISQSTINLLQQSHKSVGAGDSEKRRIWAWNVGCAVLYLPYLSYGSRLDITFLPRNQCLLISWLQSPSAVILEFQLSYFKS